MKMIQHIPVLFEEVLTHLQPEPNQIWIDGTVGQGGHADAIASRILPGGRLLAIDRDRHNLQIARERLASHGQGIVYVHDSYENIGKIAEREGFMRANGMLLDLGFSSMHIEEASRGFSFQKEGPLDMRYNNKEGMTAKEIVNTWSEAELARLFRLYGEEIRASQIARAICYERKSETIETTTQLAELISRVVRVRGATHPATKVFQALRIEVNDELKGLERALPACLRVLETGARFGIITFHSLEDRIVKQFFKTTSSVRLVTKKPIVPSREEMRQNPRSRSAKLRVVEKQQ